MPTLLGAAVIALGGMVLMRVARREWRRINQSMDEQRSAPKTPRQPQAQKLERDPETGVYRPADD